jgi:hypothetical protein
MAKTKAVVPAYDEAAALAGLAKVGKILSKSSKPGQLEAFSLSGLKLADMCKLYNQVRPYLEMGLPLIGKIPSYGPQIVLALTLLMKIADSAFPMPAKA